MKTISSPFLCPFFILFFFSASSQIPMSNWNKCFLEESIVVCGPELHTLDEPFDGTSLSSFWGNHLYFPAPDDCLNSRLHTNTAEVLFRDENVTVGNGLCTLKINPAPSNFDTWSGNANCNSNNNITVQRDLNSGTLWSEEKYSYGKFEARSKNPDISGVYTAFWLWNSQELDITDVAGQGWFAIATYDSYDPDFKFSQTFNQYDLTEWHVFSAEWTPFKIVWKIDDNVLGTLFRYFDEAGNPLDVDCGDLIEAGIYCEDPRYLEANREMSVIAWIDATKLCWTDACECDPDNDPTTHCGPNLDFDDLPADYLIDYINVYQKSYDLISLDNNCSDICVGQQTCIDIGIQNLHPDFSGSGYTITQINSSTGMSNVSFSGGQVCFTPIFSGSQPTLEVTVEDGAGNSFSVSRSFRLQARPEFIHIQNECEHFICVNPNGYCETQYDVTFNSPSIATPVNSVIVNSQDRSCIECWQMSTACVDATLTYTSCGIPVTKNFVTDGEISYDILAMDECEGSLTIQLNSFDCPTFNDAWLKDYWNVQYPVDADVDGQEITLTWDYRIIPRIEISVTHETCSGVKTEIISIDIPACTLDNCCPQGSVWNGAHCAYLIYAPEGYDPFIWQDGFYTHYGPGGPGDCPPGAIDNNAGCDYGVRVPDGYDPFIWQRGFYVHKNCDIFIEECCPPGSTWDGANCYYGIHIAQGYDGFISNDNGLYATPINNNQCPPGTTLDATGCYYGVDITPGLDGFIWNNAFYANEECDIENCCPEGATWDGKICTTEFSWPGYDGFVHANGRVYLYPDVDGGCPAGTSLNTNTNTNRCVTAAIVPDGYEGQFVDGAFGIFPDCDNCCPEGFKFNGIKCCKTIILKDIEVTIVNGILTTAYNCERFPKTCCPDGFQRGRYGCQLRQSTETETIEFIDKEITICINTESCIEEEKFKSDEDDTGFFKLTPPTSIQEFNCLVYPNPFNSSVNFELDYKGMEKVNIRITTIDGRQIFTQTFEEAAAKKVQLNLDAEAGIYLAIVEINGVQKHYRVIKL